MIHICYHLSEAYGAGGHRLEFERLAEFLWRIVQNNCLRGGTANSSLHTPPRPCLVYAMTILFTL
jgi:hypothetical protein